MGITFHEIVLPQEYSPSPSGGPEFSHSVFPIPRSGVEDINANRASALHRYTIPFTMMTPDKQAWLYSFFLAVGGIGGAFRMLAPEPFNRSFNNELLATTDGTETDFNLIKTHSVTAATFYGGATTSYVQRIVKPVYNEVELYLDGAAVDLSADGAMDWTTGRFAFNDPPDEGLELRATGRYHLPVRFTDDWFSASYDVTSESPNIGLQEVLPKTIGID